MVASCAALLSAAGIYLSYGLGDCWPLAFLAPVPLLWLAFASCRFGTVFLLAWLGYGLGSTHALAAYGGILPAPVLVLLIGGPSSLFALAVAGGGWCARRLGPAVGAASFAAFWTTTDFLSSFLRNGAVLSPAYSLVKAPWLIQSASLFGLWAVTFVLGFVAASIAASLSSRRLQPLLFGLGLLALDAGFGFWRLRELPAQPLVRVGLAADDRLLHDSLLASDSAADRVAADYAGAAQTLASAGATLIVFPEKVAILKPLWREKCVQTLAAAARADRATLVVGFDERGTSRKNEALVFTPDSSLPQAYLKRRFVPGLEDGDQAGAGPFVLPGGTGVAICKDMDYPRLLRADQRAIHPSLLAVPAWDFGADGLAHAKPAILRGVENGFAVARASRDGLLTLTDAAGRIVARRKSSPRGMVLLVGDLARGPETTLYVEIGDAFAWLSVAASLALLGIAFLRPENDAGSARGM